MSLVIRTTMPDGSQWDVPLSAVAHAFASHHVSPLFNTVTTSHGIPAYKAEMNFAMNHPKELLEWAKNNTNWSDVAASSYMVKRPETPDYQDGWINGAKEIVNL